MKVIRFRRTGKANWEIAFNEAHLREKLDGDTAEIIMPAKPWYVRMWRKVFPLRFTECSVSRQNVNVHTPLPASASDETGVKP
jgi:hypothetical protein